MLRHSRRRFRVRRGVAGMQQARRGVWALLTSARRCVRPFVDGMGWAALCVCSPCALRVCAGHGVGAALNVHEGPHSISMRYHITAPLAAGMVVSNEPG